jgi:SAM-dependent methyltransferase
MTLSELINFYHQCKKTFPESALSALNQLYDPLLANLHENKTQFHDLVSQCHNAVQHLNQTASTTNIVISQCLKQIYDIIRSHDTEYYQRSRDLFYQSFINSKPDYVLSRTLHLQDDSQTYVSDRLKMFSDWQYPGLIISPLHYDHVESMVALDPLYVADTHPDLWQPVKQRFHEAYVRRLRFYLIDDHDHAKFLQTLPAQQFGLIFSYYFFNFRPIEVLQSYLENLFSCLRPGGILAFTFNDCDSTAGVRLVENNFMCYAPGFRVRQILQSVGYEVMEDRMLDAACRWIEARRPGVLQTLRGGQCLAKIIAQ